MVLRPSATEADRSAPHSPESFFGNQNPVARPVAQSWRYTVERLKALWGIA